VISNYGGTTNLWAAARFNDPLLTNACRSALLTMVSLTSTNCSPLMTNLYFGSNGVGQLEWSGNWILQTNPTLNPLTWSNAGFPSVFGNNVYYWSNPPPIQFFRLYAPTN
jgi:hypothetical protein